MIRRFITLAYLVAVSFSYAAQETYEIDPVHSQVGFKIRHMYSNVPGRFTKYTGKIQIDPKKIDDGNAYVEIDAASVSTDNDKRDEHLRTDDFFGVKKHPMLTFQSTSFKKVGKDKLKVNGNFTLLGVTKPVTLDVTVMGFGADPWGNARAGFEGTTKINRKDFGMIWNKTLDQGGVLLGDEVEIALSVEAVRKEPTKETTTMKK